MIEFVYFVYKLFFNRDNWTWEKFITNDTKYCWYQHDDDWARRQHMGFVMFYTCSCVCVCFFFCVWYFPLFVSHTAFIAFGIFVRGCYEFCAKYCCYCCCFCGSFAFNVYVFKVKTKRKVLFVSFCWEWIHIYLLLSDLLVGNSNIIDVLHRL